MRIERKAANQPKGLYAALAGAGALSAAARRQRSTPAAVISDH
jgi:hypothetical protein